jgi:hypothetical protein
MAQKWLGRIAQPVPGVRRDLLDGLNKGNWHAGVTFKSEQRSAAIYL